MVVAVGWVVGDGEFALVDGIVGLVLRVGDTAEEFVGGGVGGVGGEGCAEEACGVFHAAFLEGPVGGSVAGERAVGRGEVSERLLGLEREVEDE